MSDSTTPPPPIDAECLLEVSAADRELGVELFDLFKDEAKRHLENLRAGLAAEDHVRVREAAHGIKGAAGTLGFLETSQTCAAIENAARNSSLESVADDLEKLNAAIDRLDSAFAKINWE